MLATFDFNWISKSAHFFPCHYTGTQASCAIINWFLAGAANLFANIDRHQMHQVINRTAFHGSHAKGKRHAQGRTFFSSICSGRVHVKVSRKKGSQGRICANGASSESSSDFGSFKIGKITKSGRISLFAKLKA